MAALVVDHPEGGAVVDDAPVGVVEEVLARAAAGVAEDKAELQRVPAVDHAAEVVVLARVVGTEVVRGREGPALEGPVLDWIVERVVVEQQVGAALASALLRAELLPVEQRRALECVVRIRPLTQSQLHLRRRPDRARGQRGVGHIGRIAGGCHV